MDRSNLYGGVQSTHRYEEVDRKESYAVLTLPPTAQTHHKAPSKGESVVLQLNAHAVEYIVSAALVHKQ